MMFACVMMSYMSCADLVLFRFELHVQVHTVATGMFKYTRVHSRYRHVITGSTALVQLLTVTKVSASSI